MPMPPYLVVSAFELKRIYSGVKMPPKLAPEMPAKSRGASFTQEEEKSAGSEVPLPKRRSSPVFL